METQNGDPWGEETLLSLDGGGIRGYFSLLILQALMEEIRRLEEARDISSSYDPIEFVPPINGNPAEPRAVGSQFLPCHYFDYIVGTSTGGLIAIMLGRLRMRVSECIAIYERLGEEFFGQPRTFHIRSLLWRPRSKYNADKFEKIIERVVNDRTLERPELGRREFGSPISFEHAPQARICRVMVFAHHRGPSRAADRLHLFHTYDRPDYVGLPTGGQAFIRDPETRRATSLPISQVARATTAAPTYMRSFKTNGHEFLDGGFGSSNNPVGEAWEEMKQMNQSRGKLMHALVSIGTGRKAISRFPDLIGLRKYIYIIKAATQMASDAELENISMERLIRELGDKEPPETYFRFSVDNKLGKMKLDEWNNVRRDGKKDTLLFIRQVAAEYINEDNVQRMLNASSQRLVSLRRRRSTTVRWAQYASVVSFHCPVPTCTTIYGNRDDLRHHLERSHADWLTTHDLDEESLTRLLDSRQRYIG